MRKVNNYLFSIILCMSLLMGFLGIAIIYAVDIVAQGFTIERLGLIIVSLGIAIVMLVKVVALNRLRNEHKASLVINDYHEFIAKWSVPEELLNRYQKTKLSSRIKMSSVYGYTTGSTLSLALGIFLVNNNSLLTLIVIVVIAFLVTFITVKQGSICIARKRYYQQLQAKSMEVDFADDLIIINGRLTVFNEAGCRLKRFEIEEKRGFKLLCLIVETGLGQYKGLKEYFIPIPESCSDQANHLMGHYASLVK